MSSFFQLPPQSNPSLKEQKSSIHSLVLVLRKVTVIMHGIFSRHCENGSYKIKVIDFDESYSPLADSDSFRINIAITDMHRLPDMILYAINTFQNTNIPIQERVYVIPPPYYLDYF